MKITRLNKSILLCVLLTSCGMTPEGLQTLQNDCENTQISTLMTLQSTPQGIPASGVIIQQTSPYQYTFVSVDPNGTLHCKLTFTGNYTSSDSTYTYQHNAVVGLQFSETASFPGEISMGILPVYNSIRGPAPKTTIETQPTIQSDTITSKVTNASIQEKNEQDQKEGAAAMQFLQKLNCRLWLPGTDGKLYCAMPQLP